MKNGILKFDSKVYIILHTDYNSEKFLNYKSSDYFRRKTTINKQKRQGKICYHWSKNSWNFWFVVSKLVLECGEQDTNDCFIKNRSKHSSNILLSLLQFFMKQTLPQTSARYWYWYRSCLRLIIHFLGREIYFQMGNHFIVPRYEFSAVNETYIDISNGQKFELSIYPSF